MKSVFKQNKIIYNSLIFLYKYATYLASFFNKKAKQRWEGIKANEFIINHLVEIKSKSESWKLAWFHAASLGEFEQARPVLEKFKVDCPHCKILLTFFSPSGFEIRKNYALADFILYLPFDLPSEMNDFIVDVQPTLVFWTKYDYWQNCLESLKKKNIPVYLFSAIFREHQYFFKWYGTGSRSVLHSFTHLFVQDDASKKLLESHAIHNVTVAGDTRFDRVASIVKSVKEIEIVERFKNNKSLLVIGSAWEEDVLCVNPKSSLFDMNNEEVKIVIAPHEIHESQIENWKIEFIGIRYSQITEKTDLSAYKVLLIDNIGLLSSIYQYANYAFIGGAFVKGLHNTLEAATFGTPIFFGNKKYKKFKEAVELIELECAFTVTNHVDFKQQLVAVNSKINSIETKTKAYMKRKTGATDLILANINSK